MNISGYRRGIRIDIRMGIDIDQSDFLLKVILYIDTGSRGRAHHYTVVTAQKQRRLSCLKYRIHILGNALTGSSHGIPVF